MSMTLTSSSRTVTVPKYGVGGLQPFLKQNFAKNRSLSGKLHVDFYNTIGGYRVTFDAIPKSEYDDLKTIFDDQLTNEEFLLLNDADLGITDLSVWLNLPEEHDLRWNKQAVLNLSITLEPENANS